MTLMWLDAAVAHAHIQLQYPAQRDAAQKRGPCGLSGSVRGDDPAVFAPGETITVIWTETIGHPGHFRISFDDDGDDDFVDPAGYDDLYTNATVLLDDIPDTGCGDVSRVAVTLPDIECERCTLQVVQVMTDKRPYGAGNDLYYQCADIALRPGGRDDPDPDSSAGPGAADSCGCQASGGPASGMAPWLAIVGLLLFARRRRSRRFVEV